MDKSFEYFSSSCKQPLTIICCPQKEKLSLLACISYQECRRCVSRFIPGFHIGIFTKHDRKGACPGRCNSSNGLWLQETFFCSPNSYGCSMPSSKDYILIICVQKQQAQAVSLQNAIKVTKIINGALSRSVY